jgi:peroxiredoxin
MKSYARIAVVLLCPLLATPEFSRGEEKLNVGDAAPDFTLPCATKDSVSAEPVTLSHVVGRTNIILAFYPADWSGGCTKEMCMMRDNFSELSGLGATVYGISGDYVHSHREWAKYHNLQFALLSDHNHSVARAYQSYNEKTGMDVRTVYVIDRRGKIAYIDLAYRPGTPESFEHLKTALKSIK